jgi:hypothetical protein
LSGKRLQVAKSGFSNQQLQLQSSTTSRVRTSVRVRIEGPFESMESFGVVNRKLAAALIDPRILDESSVGWSNFSGSNMVFLVSVLDTSPRHDVRGWRDFARRSSFNHEWMRQLVLNSTVRCMSRADIDI